ncbi:MAG: hypothetical protein GC201_03970 [Alphaproteobacteria bacterium]|nr:hypothetical protein [Alphaproteobacteria bacterium]
MGAVRTISTKLQAASSTWNDVGGDFLGSCRREQQTNPALADCVLEKQASDGIAALNGTLSSYFKALGDAAADTSFTVQPGLDKATASAAKIPGIDANQVKAVSGLVGLLARLATESMRESTVSSLIDDGAPHARTLVDALNRLVVANLTSRLVTERTQLIGRAHSEISSGPNASLPLDTLCKGSNAAGLNGAEYLLALEFCRRLDVVDGRLKALDDYKASLLKADAALAELQSNKTKLKGKALLASLYKLGTDLDASIGAVRKAFD